jgi:serine protease Do
VETGDIILKFDGKPVNASADLPRIVGSTKPGSKASLQLWRKGQTRDVTVTVGEIPDDRVAAGRGGRPGEKKPEVAANRLGLVVSDLGEDKRRDLRLPGGAVVDEVRNQPRGDVRAGDVIVAVTAKGSTTDIKSAKQFNDVLASLDKGTTITLQIRRGEANIFATIRGETSGG